MFKIFIAHPDLKLVALQKQKMQGHFQVDSAYDGLMATRKIRVSRPNLILSDYYLPRLSGLALLKFVRTQPELQTIPFIFISQRAAVEEALNLGANDWINLSETSIDYLIERIQTHVQINRT